VGEGTAVVVVVVAGVVGFMVVMVVMVVVLWEVVVVVISKHTNTPNTGVIRPLRAPLRPAPPRA
jgi:hypothetical protein